MDARHANDKHEFRSGSVSDSGRSPSPVSFRPPSFQCGLFLPRWRGKHCGHGLQLRLMRAVEARARLNGSSPTPQTTCTPPTTSFARAIACSAPGIPGPGRYALLAQERKIALTRCVPQVAFTRSVAFWPPSFFAFWDQSCGGVAMLPVRLDHW